MFDSLSRSLALRTICERLERRGGDTLLITSTGPHSASQILEQVSQAAESLSQGGVGPGALCGFTGDFSPRALVIFLALFQLGAIAVPFTTAVESEQDALAKEAGVEFWIDVQTATSSKTDWQRSERHKLVRDLMEFHHPGLIVFTSGSSGKPKAILHDVDRVASKFIEPRRGWRTVLFLLMDHFGGFNTLLSVLANGGVGICLDARSPLAVCRAIEYGSANLLPTTPTFLGMLIASGLWQEHDLSSVELVTYGAEPMPPATLARSRNIFPAAKFKQTYGLSELGVLRSASPDENSLWLKVGGKEFETRVVDGELHIRSGSTMLGYLNAPSPLDSDGWMNTGDLVEERDGLVRFLGRRSEVINVGGQKALPAEIENVLLSAPGVVDALVSGIPHTLLGQAIVAKVVLAEPEDRQNVTDRLRQFCRERLQKYKIPLRFEVVDQNSIATPRAKKIRASNKGQNDE